VFKIYLPEAEGDADIETIEVTRDARCRGEGTILLVEDDAAVRRLLEAALAEDGYTIESAGDADGALAVLDRRPVDLLVADVVMPGKSGRVLADEVTARSPRTKVLFISGYAGDALVARACPRTTPSCPSPSTSRSSSSRCARRLAAHEGQAPSMRSNLRPL
jgi:two-component system, cell cycle sensor histidine kinase and response regulator CckA